MTKKLVLSGIMTALCVMFLYLSCIIPTNTIFLFLFSTIFIAIIVVECGTYFAFSAYLSVSILSLLILPNKLLALYFILFFGYYPIIKLFIERLNNIYIEWIIKIISFNLALIIAYFVVKSLFFNLLNFKISFPILIILSEIIFIIYDIAQSYGISFYLNKFKKIKN